MLNAGRSFWTVRVFCKKGISNIMNQLSATQLRQFALIGLIILIFWGLFQHLYFFVPAILGAYTLYILLRQPLFWLTERRHWPQKAAAGALMLLSFSVLLLLFNALFNLLSGKIISLFQNSDELLLNMERVVRTLEVKYKVSLITPDNVKALSDWSVHQVQSVLSATVSGLGLLIVAYFILWFMLTEGKRMEESFFEWLPLKHENVVFVRKHLNELVWGNALGIPLMGLVQGLAGLLIYWLTGVQDPWFWFALTLIAGMMPIAGVALAYVPLSLLLLSEGEDGKALIIFLYGFLIMGSVDNIARMWFLKAINQTHPIITLFGVIAGLQLFGFIGFVFGPILIAMFIMLLRIYHKEFHTS